MTSKNIEAFADASQLVYLQLVKMAEMEQEKREALLRYDIDATERLVQSQQALVMQLDGLEKKRMATQIDAGFSNMTSREILQALPQENRPTLQPLFEKLTFAADNLQALNKISLGIAAAELKMMGQSNPATPKSGLYKANGKKGNSVFGSSSFDGKI